MNQWGSLRNGVLVLPIQLREKCQKMNREKAIIVIKQKTHIPQFDETEALSESRKNKLFIKRWIVKEQVRT